ncbi:hypothetical protein HQ560_16695, partial [bacterium]|nr:hypothetical protein [bacterium]
MSELDDFVRASQTRLGLVALLRAGAHALVVGLGAACAIVLIERGLSLGLGMASAVAVPLGLSLL